MAASPIANFGFKRGTRIIDLLVSFRFRSSRRACCNVWRTFGIGTLVRWGRINAVGANMLSLINLIEQQRQALRQRTAQIDVIHICKAVPNSRRRRATKTSPGRLDCFAGHHGSCVSKGQSAATVVCSIGNLVFLSTSPPTAEEQIVVAGFVNSRPAPPPRPHPPAGRQVRARLRVFGRARISLGRRSFRRAACC
jgi:hypothetical protein